MHVRSIVSGSIFFCLASVLIGCSNSGLDSIQMSPTSQALTVGQTAQFSVVGTYGNGKHLTTQNISSGVTYSSSAPSVATVSASGLATAVGAGNATITASATGYAGPVTSSATLTVTSAGGGVAGGNVVSIAVIPGTQSVASPPQTAQFIAIGTTSSGATVNLTNQVTWTSSSTAIATIGASSGLATAVGRGSSTITALYNSTSGGTVVTGTASFSVTGGTTQQFTGVTITPSSQTLTTLNQTGQFIALATSGTTGLSVDVTNSPQLRWSSSAPTIAPVSATGTVTDLNAGSASITALLTNSDGSVVSGTASLTTSITATPQDLLSLSIIPSSITVGNLQATGQFLAIGTYSTPPYVRDVTNLANWITSAPNVFPVTTNNSAAPTSGSQNGGVASAFGAGTAAIIAELKGSSGGIQVATATFGCPVPTDPVQPGQCFPNSQASALLSTLTVYNEGLNTNTNTSTSPNWLVTAPSATGTPDVIHCGPGWTKAGGSVCTATYPVGATVTLTAPAGYGAFGGWSSNCISTDPVIPTATGPNTCTVIMTSDDTVGAIFN